MGDKLAIDGGTPVRSKPFPTRREGIGEEELAQLTEVIRSGHMFRVDGTKTKAVEQRCASLLGVRHALAVSSGTAAIHTAVACVNPDPGDEIITTPLTDMGTVIGIIYQNAIPVFADVGPNGWHLDPESVEKAVTPRTRAIIPVHLWGMAADTDAFLAIGRKHGIPVIEDCAQAWLTRYKGRLVGTMGAMGCFSLQQSKHITSGDGGLVVTGDTAMAEHGRLFADKGWDRSAKARGHEFLGMNYRITELQSAVALAQMEKVEGFVAQRRRLGDLLTEKIGTIPGLDLPAGSTSSGNTYWFYPVRIREHEFGMSRDRFMAALGAEGVNSWSWLGKPIYMFDALRLQKTFGKSHHPFDSPAASRRIEYGPGLCPNAERVVVETAVLTVHEFYGENDIADMAAAILKVARAAKG